MTTYLIGIHDEWMHHLVAVVESDTAPTVIDEVHSWAVALSDGDLAYCDEENITPVDYFVDLAYSGQLGMETGKHEPYMDGEPREEYDEDETVQRIWAEMQQATTDSIHGHRQD